MLKAKSYLFLTITFFIYSLSLVFSKLASMQNDKTYFLVYYIVAVLIMCIYAVLWQLILKKLPLSVAFPFKAMTLIFSLILGYFIFNELITLKKVLAIVVIIIGIILVGYEKHE